MTEFFHMTEFKFLHMKEFLGTACGVYDKYEVWYEYTSSTLMISWFTTTNWKPSLWLHINAQFGQWSYGPLLTNKYSLSFVGNIWLWQIHKYSLSFIGNMCLSQINKYSFPLLEIRDFGSRRKKYSLSFVGNMWL